jgi:prephenate dehydrogenase
MKQPSVAIAGLGLVGGSLARALRRKRYRVIGIDQPAVVRRARAAGVLTAAATLEDAAATADIVVLAAPPKVNLRLVARLARIARPDLVVTDVGSVKEAICREAQRTGLAQFVGGHPMAGTAGAGFAASSADLFESRPWILTPNGAGRAAVARVRALARAAGARPVLMTPQDHDRTMAFLSHMPQVLSWLLLASARSDAVAGRHLPLAGPGFRDMTRLAHSPRRLWREILDQNRREVERALWVLADALRRPGDILRSPWTPRLRRGPSS